MLPMRIKLITKLTVCEIRFLTFLLRQAPLKKKKKTGKRISFFYSKFLGTFFFSEIFTQDPSVFFGAIFQKCIFIAYKFPFVYIRISLNAYTVYISLLFSFVAPNLWQEFLIRFMSEYFYLSSLLNSSKLDLFLCLHNKARLVIIKTTIIISNN